MAGPQALTHPLASPRLPFKFVTSTAEFGCRPLTLCVRVRGLSQKKKEKEKRRKKEKKVWVVPVDLVAAPLLQG